MATTLIKIGNVSTDTPSNQVVAWSNGTVTAGNYQTLQTIGGSNYQVTAGKSWYVGLLFITVPVTTNAIILGYGDTAVTNSVAAPTNNRNLIVNLFPTVQNVTQYIPIWMLVPASKFPFVLAISGATPQITLFGVEV